MEPLRPATSKLSNADRVLIGLLGALFIGSLATVANRLIVYQNPQKSTKTATTVKRDIVTRTTTKDASGKISTVEEIDRSVIDETASTLSIPVLPPADRLWGISAGFDPINREWWGGGSYGLLPFLDVGAKSNLKDRVFLEGTLRF